MSVDCLYLSPPPPRPIPPLEMFSGDGARLIKRNYQVAVTLIPDCFVVEKQCAAVVHFEPL